MGSTRTCNCPTRQRRSCPFDGRIEAPDVRVGVTGAHLMSASSGLVAMTKCKKKGTICFLEAEHPQCNAHAPITSLQSSSNLCPCSVAGQHCVMACLLPLFQVLYGACGRSSSILTVALFAVDLCLDLWSRDSANEMHVWFVSVNHVHTVCESL
jgi:hypothetical protein